MELNHRIVRNENYVHVEKLSKAHVMSNELSYNVVASYSFNSKEGTLHQYSGVVPKIYKSYTNWKKAVKRVFNIEVE